MARQLTSFSKFLIVLLIVGLIFFAGNYFLNNTEAGQDLKEKAQIEQIDSSSSNGSEANNNSNKSSNSKANTSSSNDKDVVKIGVVTWGGYAGGQYFNEGFEASTNSRFYKDYGIKVEFKVLDDFQASRDAFRAGEVDLLWQTIDAFPTEVNGLKDQDPVIVWQADWSRGGDAIVARRGINQVADLKGKTIAVAELTPSHSFLINLLQAGDIGMDEVKIVPQASAIDAAEVFKSKRVDAAVVWSPDDILCTKAVQGSRILESTRNATKIIADVFMAKRAYADANKDKLRKIYEGWMKGAAEINSDPKARRKAAEILAREFTDRGTALTTDEAAEMIGNVYLTTHGDNKNFFGLNTNFNDIDGNKLYSKMANVYRDLGFIEGRVPTWSQISYPSLVNSTTLTGEMHFPEAGKTFTKVTEADKTKAALSNKAVSIRFATGQYKLDDNAKYIIEKEFVDIAKTFGNARIRIEGNTDNVGNAASNKKLSERRAQAVADFLHEEHGMPRNRLIVKGNGSDNPVASNNTEAGKAKNRRTDFQLVQE